MYDNSNEIITCSSTKSKEVKEINNSRNKTFFIDVYYENNDKDNKDNNSFVFKTVSKGPT